MRRRALAMLCAAAPWQWPAPAAAAGGASDERSLFTRVLDRGRKMFGLDPLESAEAATPLAPNDTALVIQDMDRRNDAPLRGFDQYTSGWFVGPGHTMLGNDPRLKNGGKWFIDGYGSRFDLERRMTAIMPWVLVTDGKRHVAGNFRVELANVRLFMLQGSTRRWHSLGSSRGVFGDFYFKPSMSRSSGLRDLRIRSDGSVAIRMPDSSDLAFHGWWTKGRVAVPFDPADIRAVFVTMQGRLVVDDPGRPDDRDRAELLMQIGADYYQSLDFKWDGVPAPAVVSSRLKRLGNGWQAISAMTFNDVGRTDPPGRRGIDKAEFLENPPPFV
ncbi:MAG: hypothetical protein AB7G13_23190 [Lautropia sp.]